MNNNKESREKRLPGRGNSSCCDSVEVGKRNKGFTQVWLDLGKIDRLCGISLKSLCFISKIGRCFLKVLNFS